MIWLIIFMIFVVSQAFSEEVVSISRIQSSLYFLLLMFWLTRFSMMNLLIKVRTLISLVTLIINLELLDLIDYWWLFFMLNIFLWNESLIVIILLPIWLLRLMQVITLLLLLMWYIHLWIFQIDGYLFSFSFAHWIELHVILIT